MPRLLAISFHNRQCLWKPPTVRLRRVAREALRSEGIREGQLGVALVDDAEIARVHEEFLGDPSPTDVITFPYSSVEGPIEGELVVSVETALREAERRDTNPFDEVALYVIHGILHLCGHRDDTAVGGRRMWRRQSEILAGLGLGPPRR